MIRRRKTGNAIFLAVLLSCSVGAIGFSSWITASKGTESDIDISYGDTIFHNAKDIIKVENIKRLGFSQYGFSNDGEVDSTTGYLEFTVVYDFDLIEISISSMAVSNTFSFSSFAQNATNVSVYTNISNINKTYSSSLYAIKNFNSSSTSDSLSYSFEIYNITLDPTLGSGKRFISITNKILFSYSGNDFKSDVYDNVSNISNFSINLGVERYQ